LDYKIVARDSNLQDELKGDIDYYTRLIENEGEYDGLDYTGRIEWLGHDLLDLPFGMAAEIGREGDAPDGKVRWIRCLDGGTCMPSLNADYPVIQSVPQTILEPVAFPRHAITRQYWSPRPEIQYEGWGMAPPELIYLVLELMKRGDKYYAELLLNTPQVGILDLGDTSKETAQEWMKEAQDLFVGTDPMKIPVLYEHTTKVEWIPFQMAPNEIMFDSITARYINQICAGYGMSPSDIGMGGGANGGETLSGTIRDERKSKRTIQAVLKKKFKSFFDKILPETIEFAWIDFDDDQNVARGRARLANAQADEIFTRNQIYSPDELRAQGVVDGLITVSVPEKLDRSKVEWPQSGNTTRPGLIGEKVSAENGGRGEISGAQDLTARSIVKKSYFPIFDFISVTKSMTPEEKKSWGQEVDDVIWWRNSESTLVKDVDKLRKAIVSALKKNSFATIVFKSEDAVDVQNVLREKAILEYSLRVEKRGSDVTEQGLEEVESKVLALDPKEFLAKSSVETTDLARSIFATKILSETVNEMLKLGIDLQDKKHDNTIVDFVTRRIMDAYPGLISAAESAGQQILEKYLDEGAKNVQDS
jgi:hypothetical protein